jgi:hypothetical protein
LIDRYGAFTCALSRPFESSFAAFETVSTSVERRSWTITLKIVAGLACAFPSNELGR